VSASTSYAVFPTTEASQRLSGRLQLVSGLALTLCTGLAASLPVIVAAIRGAAAGWVPAADQGIIATRAYDVFSSHTPLVGQYSMATGVTGHTTYDPGPLLYWLLALPARFGAPAALSATIAVANTAAIMGCVALARRRGGCVLMFAAAAAIALMSHSFGTEALHGIWNPAAGIFALALLCFLCWSLACGERHLLAVTVLVASFVVQCHLAYIPPALALLAVALVGLALASRRPGGRLYGASAHARGHPARGPVWRDVLAAVLVALICWSAPIVDQATRSPGNLGALASAASARGRTEGAAAGWRALTRAVGIPPRWLRAPSRQVDNPSGRPVGELSGGDYGDTRLGDLWEAPSTLSNVSCVLALCGLLAVALISPRARRDDLAAGAWIGLLLCAALAWLVAATPVKDVNTLGYTLWWGSVVGMWVWLLLLWSLAELVRGWALPVARRSSAARIARSRAPFGWPPYLGPALALATGLGVVIAAGATAAASESADAHKAEFRALRAITASIERDVPRRATVLLTQHGSATVPLEPTIKYALRRRGVRVLGYGAGLRLGSWYELGDRPYELAIDLSEDKRPGVRPAGVLIHSAVQGAPWLPGGGGRHVITVSITRHAGS
jgi:hypothetical protein